MARTPAQIAYAERKKAERLALPRAPCACGCGTLIPPVTALGKPARYAHGHNPSGETTRFAPGAAPWNKGQPYQRAREVHAGKKLTPGQIAQREQTRRSRNGGVYQVARGWRHTDETRERLRQANLRRDMRGERNPFFGKRHPPELQEQIAAKIRGEKHPHWNGGTSTLPYGPGFTRRFKKLIRDRDGNRCQRCGKTREDAGRTLEIHHIDHDKANNDPTNVVTVCHSCNMWFSWHRDAPFATL